MKTLYLHIGTPKTATTALQKFCAINRKLLEEKGYCFPKPVYRYPFTSANRNAHFMIGRVKGEDGRTDKKETKRLFKLGMSNLNACFSTYDNVIMSDEDFWWAGEIRRNNVWKVFQKDMGKNGYTVKLIVYLRRQDEFFSSRWNQSVKRGNKTKPWDEHVREAIDNQEPMLEYADKLDHLAELFGKENIIVRRFNREAFYQGTVFADFLHCVGLEMTDEYVMPEGEVNSGLKGNTVEIMRVMNTAPTFSKDNKAYLGKLVSLCSEESDKYYKYSMFSQEEAAEFLEHFREGNERVAADYIGDGKPLFSYEIKNLPKWDKNNEYMLDDVIRVFTVITQDLHEEISSLKEENAAYKKELAETRGELTKFMRETEKDITRIKRFIRNAKHPFRYVWSKLTRRCISIKIAHLK